MYANKWLGFSEAELEAAPEKAGFKNVETSAIHKESELPQLQILLAGINPGTPKGRFARLFGMANAGFFFFSNSPDNSQDIFC